MKGHQYKAGNMWALVFVELALYQSQACLTIIAYGGVTMFRNTASIQNMVYPLEVSLRGHVGEVLRGFKCLPPGQLFLGKDILR